MRIIRRAVIGAVAALLVSSTFDGVVAQAASFRADSVEVDGSWLHYRTGGHGPPLLLLHGFTGTGVWWEPYLDPLAESYTTIVPDLPGHGAPAPARTPIGSTGWRS